MSEKPNLEAKKSLGQHFLTSAVVPGWLCDAATLSANELVLEIGPGTGALTAELLKRGVKVTALEADQRAMAILRERFATQISTGQLTILHCDVRHFDPSGRPELQTNQYKVVANIPYYLSGLLFRIFLETACQPRTLVYLVQKEVAKRITASLERDEKESLLSLAIKCYGKPQYVKTVGRGHFTPPPKVDSAIIAISDINKKAFQALAEKDFFHLLHLGFGQKRKQLLGNLGSEFPRPQLETVLTNLGLPLTVRAEDIDIKTWLKLASLLTKK